MLREILIVENNPDSLGFLMKLLDNLHTQTTPTVTCEAARHALNTLQNIDVLITDVKLRDGSGLELAVEAKRKCGCRTIIVGGTKPSDDAVPKEIDDWLSKPISGRQLKRAVFKRKSSVA
jgi:DNA-binding response OmpR family regulator